MHLNVICMLPFFKVNMSQNLWLYGALQVVLSDYKIPSLVNNL